MPDLFIWRMSTKKNGKCPKCGCVVRDKNNYPTDNVGVDATKIDAQEKNLYCLGCRKKGKTFVVGTVKDINDAMYEELTKEMYSGMDWDSVQKMANRNAKDAKKKAETIDSLKGQIRKLEFDNGMLKGSIENMKTIHAKEIEERDTRIRALTEELLQLEHMYDELAKRVQYGETT